MGRERLIKSVGAHSLRWKSTEEGAVDRVTAIGFAARKNELGEAMLRVNGLEAPALRKAVLLVARELNHKLRITHGFAKKIAIAALHEYLRPNCVYCGGKGHHYQRGQAVRVCLYCQGSGLHVYSDSDRALLIGGNYHARAYEDALSCVRDSIHTLVINSDRRLKG